jgi:cytochrome c peroxidase
MNSRKMYRLWAAGAVSGLAALILGCAPAEPEKTAKKLNPPVVSPAKAPSEKPAVKKAETTASANADASAKPADAPPAKSAASARADAPKVPLGLPPLSVPADNPITPAKVELGKMLYFDTRLSKDNKISCATCHDPKMAWAENEPTSKGIGGVFGQRNSPTVINAAYATSQFWDGRAATLEEQALGPIENPIEMGHKLDLMIQDLSKLADYNQRFQAVFGTKVNKDGLAKAIAAFERTILSGNSPYDRFKAGDAAALNAAQKHGMQLFDDNCATCHAPPLMSNYRFYNAGVGMDKQKPDQGRMMVTKQENDMGKFRVPALREVANTAPYFHDGSAATLKDAVALMAGGGKDNPHLSAQLKAIREAKLTEQDRGDLVEFLKSLSGEYPITAAPKLP